MSRLATAMSHDLVIRHGYAGVLGVFWLLLVLANAGLLVERRRSKPGRFVSLVPFIGGVAGVLALAIAPWAERWPRWTLLLPVLLEPGTGWVLADVAWAWLRRWTSRG